VHLVKAGNHSVIKNRLGHLVLQLAGTVTLWWALKSSEFRAILWLLLRDLDNELIRQFGT
jgi:hypothetical protein